MFDEMDICCLPFLLMPVLPVSFAKSRLRRRSYLLYIQERRAGGEDM